MTYSSKNNKIDPFDRINIPVIPRCILRQRLILQKALILKSYNMADSAKFMLQSLFKIGSIYDPYVRKKALKNLLYLYKCKKSTNKSQTELYEFK